MDQSQGMLACAQVKFPDIPVEKVGLQEMGYQEAFDSALCIDAMENVFPEEWPLVLSRLYGAIKSQAYLYFTVEIADEKEVGQAPFRLIEEAVGDDYHHFLVQKDKQGTDQSAAAMITAES